MNYFWFEDRGYPAVHFVSFLLINSLGEQGLLLMLLSISCLIYSVNLLGIESHYFFKIEERV